MYAKTLMIASAFVMFLLGAGLNEAYAQDAATQEEQATGRMKKGPEQRPAPVSVIKLAS